MPSRLPGRPREASIRRWELLFGKILPNLLVAYGQMTIALLVARWVFDVPIRGSLVLLYALSLVFMFGTLGIGIFVSAASRTVPQAMQLAFLTFLPSIYLSGLLFPIEGMPVAAQYLASVIPLTYYLRVVRGIVLKGIGLDRIQFLTVPWETYPPDHNRVQWAPESAQVWKKLRLDEPLPNKFSKNVTTAAEEPGQPTPGPSESPSTSPTGPSGSASPSPGDAESQAEAAARAQAAAENGLCA